MGTETIKLVPDRTDADTARDLRVGIENAIKPLLEVINEGKNNGFDVHFQLGPIYNGRIGIQQLKIVKEF